MLRIPIAMQAAQRAQQDAAHAAEELAHSQMELRQSREAEKSAHGAQSRLEAERATLLEAIREPCLYSFASL